MYLKDVPLFLWKGSTFLTSCLRSCTLSSFWKDVCSKRKEFAPLGSKFFPFRADAFSEWERQFTRVASPESGILFLKMSAAQTSLYRDNWLKHYITSTNISATSVYGKFVLLYTFSRDNCQKRCYLPSQNGLYCKRREFIPFRTLVLFTLNCIMKFILHFMVNWYICTL